MIVGGRPGRQALPREIQRRSLILASSREATDVAGRRHWSDLVGVFSPGLAAVNWRPRRKVLGFWPGSVRVISNVQSRSTPVLLASMAMGGSLTISARPLGMDLVTVGNWQPGWAGLISILRPGRRGRRS